MKRSTMLFVMSCLALGTTSAFAAPAVSNPNNNMLSPAELLKQEEDIRLARKALNDAERANGLGSLRAAEQLDKVARVYASQGKYAAAEHYLKRALKIREVNLGDEHADVAKTLGSMGELYFQQKKYADAGAAFKRALMTSAVVYGKDSIKLVEPISRLADLQERLREFELAIQQHERVLDIREKVQGADHRDLDVTLMRLAHLYHKLNQYDQASNYLARALKLREKHYGPDSSEVKFVLFNQALIEQERGKTAEAEALFKRANAIGDKESTKGEVSSSIHFLAERYEALKLYSAAEDLHKRSLRLAEKEYGPNSIDVAHVLEHLVHLYKAQNKFSEALPVAKRSLSIYEKVYDINHVNHGEVSKALNSLAQVQLGLGNADDAEKTLNQALTILQSQRSNPVNEAIVLDTLADVYKKQNKADLAAQTEAKAKQMRSTWH